jgi:hypothetical protein
MSQTGGRSTGQRAQALINRWWPVKPVVAGRAALETATVMGVILATLTGFEQQLAPDFPATLFWRRFLTFRKL